MPCDISSGRLLACKDSVGGIKNVYFIPYTSVVQDDIVFDANEQITSFGASAPTAYRFQLKGGSSLDQTITSSRDNGTTYFEQALTLTLQKVDYLTNNQIKYLAWSRPIVVVEDYNNNLMVVGLENGAEVTGGTIVSGTAMGDLYGYTLTLSGMEKAPASFLTSISAISVSASEINP